MSGGGMQARQSPCPHRCFDDLGSAYAMGCLGGAAWHGMKGMRNAPRGDRLRGGYQQIVLRAPALGGNFAVWGGLFSAFDCTLTSFRQKEDPINAISAGFLTGGVLAARAGPKAALMNATIGGVLLGLIEGLSFVIGRYSENPSAAAPPVPGLGAAGAPGMTGGLKSFAAMPQRTFTTTLDDPTAQFLSLEDEDTSQFASTSATQPESSSNTSKVTSTTPAWSLFPNATFASKKPVYAAAVEFSTDDFAFNDADDFEDEQN